MKKYWKSLIAAGTFAFILASTAGTPSALAKVQWDGFDLQAHRGGRDVRPENTLASFSYAMELGVTTLEMDMQLTKDGRIVLSHNPKLEPHIAKDKNGKWVEEGKQPDMRLMTLEQIKEYSVGTMNPAAKEYYAAHGVTQVPSPWEKIPTLDEIFELANAYGNKKVLFNIETKSYADPLDPDYPNNPDPAYFAKKVLEVVKKYHMENRVTIQSFDWKTLVEVRKLDPNITLVALTCEQPSWGSCYRQVTKTAPSPWMAGLNIHDFNGDYVKAAHAIHADVVSPYHEELNKNLVDEAHKLGMKVVPWTVNTIIDMNKMLELGVDGIISDKPEILRQFLQYKGIKVPAPTPKPANLAENIDKNANSW